MKSFSEISYTDFSDQNLKKIYDEIRRQTKEYILGVNENEYKDYLYEKYSFVPLEIHTDTEVITQTTIRGNGGFKDRYTFEVKFNFSGSEELFKVRPSTYIQSYTDIIIFKEDNTVRYAFHMTERKPEAYENEKRVNFRKAFGNLGEANSYARRWNDGLKGIIERYFREQKDKFIEEDSFFEAINIPINKKTEEIFTPPTVVRKAVPQIVGVKDNSQTSPVPILDNKIYEDILNIISIVGKSMERKPSLYIGKDEEALRDVFLLFLETRYEAVTASGETFNRGGKTDIILKYAKDGTNLFVAECKIWHGASALIEAINQLFENYLTWRDSKTALILFVQNKQISKILETIRQESKLHQYFLREIGKHSDTSLSYVFHLPGDKAKEVFLEIVIFHFDLKED